MGLILKVLLGIVLVVVGWNVLTATIGAVFWLLGVAIKLAILGALVGGGVYAYRRLSGGSKARKPRSLGRGGEGSDWAYIRGKVDRETYLRHKSYD